MTWEETRDLLQANKKTLYGNRFAIHIFEASETYGNTSILVPDTVKPPPLMGHVVAVGTNIHDDYKDIEIGDVLSFSKWNTNDFEFNLDNEDVIKCVVISALDIFWGEK